MGKRVAKAVEVLRSGGCWRKALETAYHFRGEQFHYRLRDSAGRVVPGFGFAVWLAMDTAGLLCHRPCAVSSVWPEEWVLSAKPESATEGSNRA